MGVPTKPLQRGVSLLVSSLTKWRWQLVTQSGAFLPVYPRHNHAEIFDGLQIQKNERPCVSGARLYRARALAPFLKVGNPGKSSDFQAEGDRSLCCVCRSRVRPRYAGR
jgi:hypothetical protein